MSEDGYPYICTGNCPHDDKVVPIKPVTFIDKKGCIQTYDHSHNVASVPEPDCTNAKDMVVLQMEEMVLQMEEMVLQMMVMILQMMVMVLQMVVMVLQMDVKVLQMDVMVLDSVRNRGEPRISQCTT